MQTVIIVIHLMIVAALVGVVLLQRSEGGGLGIGGGSGFMTARGATNALTRTTAILAACFFVTSLALSLIARYGSQPTDILNNLPANSQQTQGKGGAGVLDQLGGDDNKQAPADSNEATPKQTPAETNSGPAVPNGASDATPSGNAAPGSANGSSSTATGNGAQTPAQNTPKSQVPTGQ